MVDTYVPERGDIVWINFSPQRGHEQAGRRPAIVLSPSTYNAKSGLMLACPITSKAKGYPFEVPVTLGDTDSVILADQIKCVDWRARRVRLERKGDSATLEDTCALLRVLVIEPS